MTDEDPSHATNALEFEQTGEEDLPEIDIAPDKRAIRTKSVDPEITSLHDKWKRGRLILQPDFQRQFVWDRKKASKLIESALLAVPLPIIYLAEDADGKESVIDGQQRLTSFFSFLDGKFPNGEPFALTGLQVFSELNRKRFDELDESLQDKIRYCQVRAITILKESDGELKFEIFERLNTGSVALNDMELRNCVYRGNYISLLKELAADKEFLDLIGIQDPDKRMREVELVLRFAAFFHFSYLKYQPPMRRFFNRDMEIYQHIKPDQAQELRGAFKNAVHLVKSLFGDKAFKRFYGGTEDNPNGAWEPKKFNFSLYDVMMGVLCDKPQNQVYAALDSVREAFLNLMSSDKDFIDSILLGTSNQDRVRTRFDLARRAVDEVLNQHKSQPRCFSLSLKKELFAANPECAICKQHIQHLDDAAVDHIQQYWQGGKTIPENARLTHRYCNWSRPRNDGLNS